MEKRNHKKENKIIKPFIFMRNQPCHFTAEQCRSALRQWCLNPKEMKGLSTQGSGIDQVVSVFQHFLHLQRQGKRPKVHAKQKGSKNFFNERTIVIFSICLLYCFFDWMFTVFDRYCKVMKNRFWYYSSQLRFSKKATKI